MPLNTIAVHDSANRWLARWQRRGLLMLALLICGHATAEGTRTLHPAGANGERGVMDVSDSSFFANVARGRQFLYVYARAGEYILLGSRNRSNGGDAFVYDPQSFGTPGDETVPGTADFTCSSQAGRGTIAGRAAELAGPNSADGTATVTDGFTPCSYLAPVTGIYGVRFTGATSGGQTNTASIATPPILSGSLVSAWDVTIRASADSLTDINGRLFTYAWTVYLQSNGRRLDNDLYYVSSDGYRYRQSLRGIDPNRAAFYANSRGFIDTDGGPLYRDIRGNNAAVTAGPSIAAGVTAQRPQYPIFFSDVSPSGANASEVDRVLTALAIPLAPLPPQLGSPSFVGNIGGNTSTVSSGGVFTFTTLNTLTYEIVISRDGVDFDPANVLNRVLTGIALSGSHTVLWDGLDNDGNPFPVGDYEFRIVGRNGEIHFPMIDIEANTRGGPTLTKLNGTLQEATTVYFDDRGYTAANGTLIGQLNGHLCGAGSLIAQPVPNHSLVGVDSANANLGGSGNYYRSWGGSADNNNDCTNNATQYFATAKGLDLWALEKSDVTELPIEIVEPSDGVDVGTMVSVTPAVLPGDTAYGSFVFSNAGDQAATGVTYGVTLGNAAQPGTCPAAVNFTLVPAGVVATYNPAPACTITFAGMPTTLAPGQSLAFNFNYVVLPANPGPIPVVTTIAAANENNDVAPNTADAETVVARPVINVAKSASPAPGTEVDIGDTITYTLSATIANAPLTAALTLADSLGAGLAFGSVSSSHAAFTCGGGLSCTLPAGTATGTYTVVYTATVEPSAVGSVANNVVPSGGGGDNPPTCAPCSVEHPLVPPPAFPFCPAAGDPAQVFNVVNGVEIYGYTPPGTAPDVPLPLVPATISGNLNALMLDPVRNRLLLIQRSSGTQSTLWAYDPANGGWYVAFGPFTSPDFPRGGFNAAGTGYLLAGGTSPEVWEVVSSSTFGYTVAPIGTMNYDNAPTDTGSGDIAFDGGGRAWLAVGQDIYHLDLGGGSPFTAVRQTRPLLGGSPSTIGWAGIAFAADGTLILANNAPSPSAYYQYDPATGVIIHRVDTTANAARDLTSCAFPIQLEPELSVAKVLSTVNGVPYTPPAAVSPGDVLTYALTITNSGGAVATLFAGDVVETVPADTTHVGGDSFTCDAPTAGSPCGNALAFNLAAGASSVLTFTVQVNPTVGGASITNAATIPGEVDCAIAPNDCGEVTPVNPSITLAKTLQSGGPTAEPGETLTYAITLSNGTGTPATGYGVTDVLDPNLAFLAASNGGSHAGGTVTWSGLTVPANGSLVLTVQAVVADPLPAGVSQIVNLAYETGTTPPGCPPAGAHCVVTPTAPDIALVKMLAGESGSVAGVAEPGEQLTYTITLSNSGGSDAIGYGVTDELDPNVAFASADNGGALVAGNIEWSALSIPSGGNLVLTVVVTVADPLPAGVAQIANLVYETGTTPPACPPNGPQCVVVPTEAAVTISKALAAESGTRPGQAEAGEQLTWTITLANSGGTDATNVGVTDALDANTSFVSASNGGAHVAGVVTWSGLGVPAGGSLVLTVVATVDDPIADGVTRIANLAYETGTTPPACPPSGSQCVVVPTAPVVTIAKSASAPMPTGNPDEYAITYVVTVDNRGGSTGSYDLADALAFNGATISAISAPVYATTTGDIQDGALGGFGLPAGGSIVTNESIGSGGSERWTYTVTYAVADGDLASDCSIPNGGLRNHAELGGDSAGAPPAETCSGAPSVGIVKTATAPAPTGNPNEFTLTYTVDIANTGSLAGIYDLSDTLAFNGATVSAISTPAYASASDVQDGALGVFTPPGGGTIVTGESISAGGAESWSYTVTYTVTDAGSAQDCVDPSGGLRNAAQLGGSLDGESNTCTGAPAVVIGKSVSGPGATGNPGEYTLDYLVTVQNDGSLVGTYDLTDTFAFAGVTVTSVSAIVHGGSDPLAGVLGTLTAAGGTIVGGETIAAGASETYAYSVTFTLDDLAAVGTCAGGGGLVNQAALGGSSAGQVGTCSDIPDLAITKSAGTPAPTGTPNQYTLAYTVRVDNAGAAAGSYDLADAFDFAGATIDAVSVVSHIGPDPLGGTLGTLTPVGGTVVAGETIAAGSSESFVYAVTFTLTDPAAAAACANANGGLRNAATLGGSAVGDAQTCTSMPAVAIVKALAGENGSTPGVAEPGEQLTYTITLTNTGDSDATNYGVTDQLDPNTAFVAADNGGVHAAGLVAWSGLSVPANGTLALTVVVGVADPLPAGVTEVANVAYETGTTPPACPPGGPQCVVIPVDAAITLSKSVVDASGNGEAEAGELLTYTITLAHAGGSDATGVGVTDPLDPNTTFVSADHGGSHAAGTVSWSDLVVPAGGSLQLTVVVAVADPLPAGVTHIGNLAYETGTTPPDCDAQPRPANCTDIPVAGLPHLMITKTADSATLEPGGLVVYTISVANDGDAIATGVEVSDPLPAGIVAFAWTCSASGGVSCPNAAGTGAISEMVPAFPVGGLLVYSVTATLSDDPPGSVVNTATVTPGGDATCGPDNTVPPCPATVIGTVVPGGGGEVRPVPTTSEWALLLMALMIGGWAGVAAHRRERWR